jgi:hypothetical protein
MFVFKAGGSAVRWFLVSTWFQLIWFCAVLGEDSLALLTGTLVLVALSWEWSQFGSKRMFTMLLVACLGVLIDGVNRYFGVLNFTGHHFPWWLVALWVGFAWYSLSIMPLLANYSAVMVVTLGAILGVVSYFAAIALSTVSFGYSSFITSLILYGQWWVLMAFIVRISHAARNKTPLIVHVSQLADERSRRSK